MANWNPSSTALKGLEWGPAVAGSVVLDSFTKSAVMSVRQSTAQTIGTARVWVGSIPTRGGTYVVEVYDGETCVATGTTSTLTANPNQDISGVGTGAAQWRQSDGSTVNIYDRLNLGISTEYIYAPLQHPNWAEYRFAVGTAGLGLAGKRILSVRLVVYARAQPGPASFSVGLYINGVQQRGMDGIITVANLQLFQRTWAANPYTGLPWTVADVEALDAAGTTCVYVSAGPTTGAIADVTYAWVEVVAVGPDNRLAFGTLDDSASQLTPNAWNEATLLTPAGGTWTKDASGWHTYVVRRVSSTGSMIVPTLAAAAHPYPAEGWTPTLNPSTGDATAMNSVTPNLYGLIQRTTAPAESTDSQPYATQTPALVFTGQDAEQELSDLAIANYGGVRAWVKPNDATQPLLIKAKRRSDNVQMGQTITVTATEAAAFDDAGSGWREAVVQMASGFTAATATQYYLEFSSAATGTSTDYWSVLALDTGNQGNGATHGGTTDRALVNGTEADRYELAATLWTLPTAPAGLIATADTQEQPEWTALPQEGCLPLIINFVHLAWTATVLGAGFDHYELQRSDDNGVTWATVGNIAVESTVTFDDYETSRGSIAAQYRLRVWRSDEARSAWTATATAPLTPAIGHELLFTTNADPGLNCAYNREGTAGMEFTFLEAAEVVFQKIYGRDYQVAFQPTEWRGASFSVPLIINAVREPTVTLEGMPLFQAIREIAKADVSYVCVLDHYGNRWFAQLQVPGGTHSEPKRIYIAQIVVTEVSGDPIPVEVI